jgi:hypothetical protein
MPRPFTRRQARENDAFLDQLRRTGNARLAARAVGAHRAKFTKRRASHAAFAARWEMALAACDAALKLGGGPRSPEGTGLRTEGGEPTIVRLGNGRLQLRLAPPGRMTAHAEQLFFRALAASANVRLSAAAAGFAAATFYGKKRTRPWFAGEMRYAVTIGCDRLEDVLMERVNELFGEAAPWREGAFGDDNPLPRMTVGQCIHLVTLHQNRDRLRERIDRQKSRPAPFEETRDGYRRRREAAARARHYEATGDWRFPHEPPLPQLPSLDLVTGWSKANPDRAQVTYNPDLPLFGGWRLEDWERRKRGG